MPNDAVTQFLGKVAELRRSLATSNHPGGHCVTEASRQAIRCQIAEYERAIIVLIPKAECLGNYVH